MNISLRKLLATLSIAVAVLAFGNAYGDDKSETTVICKDGATSPGGRGACRGHGGVDKAKSKAQGGGAEAKAAPAKAEEKAPSGSEEMVTCKDGASSKGGRGACRGHGGVDKSGGKKADTSAKAAPAAAPAQPAAEKPMAEKAAPAPTKMTKSEPADEAKGPATAKCKDGSMSYSKHHTGACSHHGGVAEWLDAK